MFITSDWPVLRVKSWIEPSENSNLASIGVFRHEKFDDDEIFENILHNKNGKNWFFVVSWAISRDGKRNAKDHFGKLTNGHGPILKWYIQNKITLCSIQALSIFSNQSECLKWAKDNFMLIMTCYYLATLILSAPIGWKIVNDQSECSKWV